jgi:hypothetical protein
MSPENDNDGNKTVPSAKYEDELETHDKLPFPSFCKLPDAFADGYIIPYDDMALSAISIISDFPDELLTVFVSD